MQQHSGSPVKCSTVLLHFISFFLFFLVCDKFSVFASLDLSCSERFVIVLAGYGKELNCALVRRKECSVIIDLLWTLGKFGSVSLKPSS